MSPAPRAFAARVKGKPITGVRRIAKRVVIDLDSGDAIVIEPRMTGLMLLSDPPSREHLRVEWRLGGAGEYSSVWFWDRRGLGTIRLLSPDEFSARLGEGTLGRDALLMTEADWRTQCARTHRPIKVALLDQKLVAGIGNLYASEILHLARIHPATPASALTRRQIARMHAAVEAVLTDAILHEGSTLGDATYRTALNQSGGYQNAHRVYDRAGEQCPTCRKTPIERIVQAQRSTFFCPRCQREGEPRSHGERQKKQGTRD